MLKTTELSRYSTAKRTSLETYYNVFYGDVTEMNLKLPKEDYIQLIVDIPYGFQMAGSSYDDEPFKSK